MLTALVAALSSVFKTRAALQLENLARDCDRLAPKRLSSFLDLGGRAWPARPSVGFERHTRSDPSDEPSEPNLGSPRTDRSNPASRRSPSPVRTARSLKLLEPIPVSNGDKL